MKIKILYRLGWSLTRLLSKVVFRIRVSGSDRIPKDGPVILASNHISWYDPPLVGSWMWRETHFFAKSGLFEHPLFGAIIRRTNALPVKRGTIDREALKLAYEALRKPSGLVIFPEGTRSRSGEFRAPKLGVGMIARKIGCPIVPIYIHGANRLKDCFWGRQRLSITYGEPISVDYVNSVSSGRPGYQEIADTVMARIAALKEDVIGSVKSS
ncbi:MAG: 1-acyl-sn-glycerol-3-phosphate acyltransferase [candidate division Zixibacteria bacterium]|nr:1-acyl-sn-glycerol-3-phosphate acyltransferase [candidate division Zixibacteria bacterium]